MAEINLRPYQSKAISEVREALAKYRRVLFQSPTGSGKGVVLGTIASLSHAKGKKILIACHRIEIVKQNIKFNKVAFFVAFNFVVKASISTSTRF